MIESSLFSSDKSSVWDPKRIREFLHISEDQLNQLHNISVWSKDISNSTDKDRAESSVQDSQGFGLESQISLTRSKEAQEKSLQSNSILFTKQPECQNLQISNLQKSKARSVSWPNLSKVGQDLLNNKTLKSSSIPNIFEKLYISEAYSNKIFTCNLETITKTMEVITQLDINVSTHVKKGVTEFEIIQEKHEGDKEAVVNAGVSSNDSEPVKEKHCIEEESSSSSTSCDKMEVDLPHVIETANNVASLNEQNASPKRNDENCNKVDGKADENSNGSEPVQDKHSIQVEESNLSLVSHDGTTEEIGNNSESVQDKHSTHIEESNSSSLCDKMELDPPKVKETVATVDSLDNENELSQREAENANEKDDSNASASASSDNMESDPPIAKSTASNVETFQDEKDPPLQVNEDKNGVEVTATSCDKKESLIDTKEALADSASSNDEINANGAKLNEAAEISHSESVSTILPSNKIESNISDVKQTVPANTSPHTSTNCSQDMDEAHEMAKENLESSSNIVPEVHLADKDAKKSDTSEVNQDPCDLYVAGKPISDVPCKEFPSNVSNKNSVPNTVGKKRKLETKPKISKKRRSQEKHAQVDAKNRISENIHYSLDQIETLLDIMKQFL